MNQPYSDNENQHFPSRAPQHSDITLHTEQSKNGTAVDAQADDDLAMLIEKLWQELNAICTKPELHRAVERVAVQYKDAKIKQYVPILMQREIREQLAEYVKE